MPLAPPPVDVVKPRVSEARVLEDHGNQFGIVRLVLAFLVVVSHTYPLVRGQGMPDPLLTLTHTTTFGELAVDFFFVISGYLVTQSLRRSASVTDYIRKRLRRIYPGFAVAVPMSVLLGLSCAGHWQLPKDIFKIIFSLITLGQPIVATSFGGNAYPIPNGALWTIRYEALCYLLPIALCIANHSRATALTCATAFVLMLLSGLFPRDAGGLLATLHNPMRLVGCFLAGIALLDLTEMSPPSLVRASVAGIICVAGMFWMAMSIIAIGAFGGYAVLAVCRHPGISFVSRVGRRNDCSYGVYLYGWPLQSLIIWLLPAASPLAVIALAVPLSLVAGWLSWTFVEAPFLKRRLRATVTFYC